MLVDDKTLKSAVGHCSPAFQQELEVAAQRHRVNVETIMRDRLLANLQGRPPRYLARPSAPLRLAVDNS